ncbi:MAG: HAMP domain-containing protein, partial [Magnetococcales bacterium]|nr:HAMP domain-containing protein [Magnetococcales bacterium]
YPFPPAGYGFPGAVPGDPGFAYPFGPPRVFPSGSVPDGAPPFPLPTHDGKSGPIDPAAHPSPPWGTWSDEPTPFTPTPSVTRRGAWPPSGYPSPEGWRSPQERAPFSPFPGYGPYPPGFNTPYPVQTPPTTVQSQPTTLPKPDSQSVAQPDTNNKQAESESPPTDIDMGGISVLAQVQLSDGRWAAIRNHHPEELFLWPENLLTTLGMLFLVLVAVAVIAVRLATQPLTLLARAAESLGHDINRPSITETGPREVRRAAEAFNTMQARIQRYVQERTHLLAALSHDLKTPITRMRLRAEMIDDDTVRTALIHNLEEMESMAVEALDYIRGMEGMEKPQRVDLTAILETIQQDCHELNSDVSLDLPPLDPVLLMPQSIKRCLANLIQNAVAYGGHARIGAVQKKKKVLITITDNGPGIPTQDLERVFEPFVRLEDSRNRHTGGTGLGLSIARNIARAHGGDVVLKNGNDGGLIATVILPKKQRTLKKGKHSATV